MTCRSSRGPCLLPRRVSHDPALPAGSATPRRLRDKCAPYDCWGFRCHILAIASLVEVFEHTADHTAKGKRSVVASTKSTEARTTVALPVRVIFGVIGTQPNPSDAWGPEVVITPHILSSLRGWSGARAVLRAFGWVWAEWEEAGDCRGARKGSAGVGSLPRIWVQDEEGTFPLTSDEQKLTDRCDLVNFPNVHMWTLGSPPGGKQG
jgi:hypothetical protein